MVIVSSCRCNSTYLPNCVRSYGQLVRQVIILDFPPASLSLFCFIPRFSLRLYFLHLQQAACHILPLMLYLFRYVNFMDNFGPPSKSSATGKLPSDLHPFTTRVTTARQSKLRRRRVLFSLAVAGMQFSEHG
jgi:hypothetical protein